MKGRWIRYSPAEQAWLAAHKHLPRRELWQGFITTFGRKDVSDTNIKSYCTRQGWKTGRTGCFVPGQPPMNKGLKMPSNARSAAHQFKPGQVPPNRNPLWTERDDGYGYIEMKAPAPNPYTGHKTRYIHKHRWNWEQANGPLPKGMVLKCLDGNKRNCAAENWEAIPRALLPRLNGRFGRAYDSAAPALKPTIMAIAKLEHAARLARNKGSAK